MNLEDITLSEISQSKKRTNAVLFHSYEVPRGIKFTRQKVEWGLPGARGRGNGELALMRTEFQFGKMTKFWGWMVVVVA